MQPRNGSYSKLSNDLQKLFGNYTEKIKTSPRFEKHIPRALNNLTPLAIQKRLY